MTEETRELDTEAQYAACQAWRTNERARIVEWLREQLLATRLARQGVDEQDRLDLIHRADTLKFVANAIEGGHHLKDKSE